MNSEFPHGIMFHHFHDNCEYAKQQGSISSEELYYLILYLKKHYRVLSASSFLENALNNSLCANDIVLTFDDNLLCQYHIAKPVLDDFNITAFWFINTLFFEKGYNLMDIYRHFRNNYFERIDDFYNTFFKSLDFYLSNEDMSKLRNFKPNQYLPECPFYSDSDRKFKYIRDELLHDAQYDKIMLSLMEEKHFDFTNISLWMTDNHLLNLHNSGHIIGLHSHLHSMRMEKMSVEEQITDFKINYSILYNILHTKIVSVSYPCGSYSQIGLDVLSKMGVLIGFLDYYNNQMALNNMLIPREDHSNIIRKMWRHQ